MNNSPKTPTPNATKTVRAVFYLLAVLTIVNVTVLHSVRQEQLSQAKQNRVENAMSIRLDLRLIQKAAEQYNAKDPAPVGTIVAFSDLQPFLKTLLKNLGPNGNRPRLLATGADPYGEKYGPIIVDGGPGDVPPAVSVPPMAFATLSDVAPASFWSPFKTP
jgi:hypothetical protein